MEGEPISVGRTVDLDEDGYLVTKLPDGKEVLVFRRDLTVAAIASGAIRWSKEKSRFFFAFFPASRKISNGKRGGGDA